MQSLSDTKWDCQVSRCVDTEVQKEDSVRRDEETAGTGVEGTGKSEGEPNTGRTTPEGPRTHAHRDPSRSNAVAQVIGFIKGKMRNMDRSRRWSQKELRSVRTSGQGADFVSTAGMGCEETVREYIRKQEDEDKRLDQLKMFDEQVTFRKLTVFNRFERFMLSNPRLCRGISD